MYTCYRFLTVLYLVYACKGSGATMHCGISQLKLFYRCRVYIHIYISLSCAPAHLLVAPLSIVLKYVHVEWRLTWHVTYGMRVVWFNVCLHVPIGYLCGCACNSLIGWCTYVHLSCGLPPTHVHIYVLQVNAPVVGWVQPFIPVLIESCLCLHSCVYALFACTLHVWRVNL